jgi:hypothetical protein
MARDRRSLGDLPVKAVTADGGRSDKKDQQFWKRLSSNFSQSSSQATMSATPTIRRASWSRS